MRTISLKLSRALLSHLEEEAGRKGVSKSAVVRQCIEQTLRRRGKRQSCLDLISDLVGSQPGPADASSNKDYLTDAVVRDFSRGRKNNR